MRKRIFVATLILLLAVTSCLALAACQDGLSAPANIAIRGNDLSWDRVQGAESYIVTIVGEDYEDEGESDDGFYRLELTEPGDYTITVVAVDAEGNRSDPATYVYTFKVRLAAPSQPVLGEDGKTISWGEVENAASYSLRIWDTLEDELIEYVSVDGTSYELPDKYEETGGYEFSVAAIAAEGSNYSDSTYSAVFALANSEQLAVPAISSLSTRIRWAAVSGASGYDVKLTNRENADATYSYHVTTSSTSTTASVALTSFGIEEAGAYDIQVRATGDGVVYLDSEWSEPSEEYVVYKLADFDENNTIVVESGVSADSQVVKFDVTAEQAENVEHYIVSAYAIDGDGSASVSVGSFDLDIDGEQDGWSVVDNGDGTKTYTVSIDKIFFDAEGEAAVAQRYYGRSYEIRVQAKREDSEGVIDGDSATAEGCYISYLTPTKDGEDYLISNAGELAYMHFEPDASYILTANIDFQGYMWRTIDSFGGSLSNRHNYIISDIVYASDGDELGFFGTLTGSVRDIVIADARATSETGVLVGLLAARNDGEIAGSFVTGTIDAAASVAGGLVGDNNGTISQSAANVDVTAALAGGLVAINRANEVEGQLVPNIAYSQAFGTIAAQHSDAEIALYDSVGKVYAGGFVGENHGYIMYSSYEGNVTAANSVAGNAVLAGGFAAFNDGEIEYSYAGANYSNNNQLRNTVSATSSTAAEGIAAGGFVGSNAGAISSCYANIRATASKAGGFVGSDSGTVSYSYSIGGIGSGVVTYNGFAGTEGGAYDTCLFYDADLGAVTAGDGVTRVTREGSDFASVGAAMAEALADHGFVKSDNAANAVLVNHYYVAAADRHLTLTEGQAVDLTVWRCTDDGLQEITYAEGMEGARVFGSEVGSESRTAGEYAIQFSNGAFSIFIAMTVNN